jgi:acyl carrier protein
VAPRSELERRLADLLREVLGVERVGVLDGFFQLGASSVHMVQLNNRLRSAIGRELSIVDMFRFSNVATLAAHLATLPEEGSGPPSLARAESRAEARREEMARRRGARRRDAQGGSDE